MMILAFFPLDFTWKLQIMEVELISIVIWTIVETLLSPRQNPIGIITYSTIPIVNVLDATIEYPHQKIAKQNAWKLPIVDSIAFDSVSISLDKTSTTRLNIIARSFSFHSITISTICLGCTHTIIITIIIIVFKSFIQSVREKFMAIWERVIFLLLFLIPKGRRNGIWLSSFWIF